MKDKIIEDNIKKDVNVENVSINDRNIRIASIIIDILVIISLVILNINNYTRLNMALLLAMFSMKILLKFKKMGKRDLYSSLIVIVMLAATAYTLIENQEFQFGGYMIMSVIVGIFVLAVIIPYFKDDLSVVSSMLILIAICITFGYTELYDKGKDEVRDRLGVDCMNKITAHEKFDKYELKRLYGVKDALKADKKFKENLYKIIKAIENDSTYTSNVVKEVDGDKLTVLSEIGIDFLNQVNKREDCTIDDLYNSEYVNSSIVTYGGK